MEFFDIWLFGLGMVVLGCVGLTFAWILLQ
jgi:hypothetical protein